VLAFKDVVVVVALTIFVALRLLVVVAVVELSVLLVVLSASVSSEFVSFIGFKRNDVEFRRDDDNNESDGCEEDDVEGVEDGAAVEVVVGVFGDGKFVLCTRNRGRTARRQVVVVEKLSNRCLCR
jgi:hypothetical protein